jgi:hypothetical protein
MHYAEFGEDEVCIVERNGTLLKLFEADRQEQSAALLSAIREYDTNKWKVIGQKVGKPAKVLHNPVSTVLWVAEWLLTTRHGMQACEQYAKEHFSGK